ncbi:hypothetical protein DRQ25_01730, partial [Candidatus Fermentibacteria bacterium]
MNEYHSNTLRSKESCQTRISFSALERTQLWHLPRFRIIILIFSLIFVSTALADTPSDNDIPTLAMRIVGSYASFEYTTIELLCELSWLNFDAVNFDGTASHTTNQNLMSLCDSAGMYYSICPGEVMQYLKHWGDPEFRYWFRNSDSLLTSDYCFARSNADFDSIEQYTTAESLYYDDPDYSIGVTIGELAESADEHDLLWFYEVYDEANSQQRRHSVEDTLLWDDYIPNVYTQHRLENQDPPPLSLEEVEASGIFSIQKYYAENDTLNPVTFTMNFALLHTIDQEDYTGLGGDIVYGTMTDQAI